MATRPIFNKADIASTNATTSGNALTAEFATQAFPESQNKRFNGFTLKTVAPTAGATATEAFIDGIQNFRFRLAERSTVMLAYVAAYNNNVAGSNAGFSGFVAAQNVGGVITILANATQVKYPNAAVAALTLGTDATNQALTFTVAGVAGDTNGQWEIVVTSVAEITDLG